MQKIKRLINLSNHPFATWSAAQKEASQPYGVCIDMPFPSVSAHATEEEIAQLVTTYFTQIVEHTKGYEVTVHLMGELTFSFQLAQQLHLHGIKSIASCADRNVLQEGEVKKVIFDFVRFREFYFA